MVPYGFSTHAHDCHQAFDPSLTQWLWRDTPCPCCGILTTTLAYPFHSLSICCPGQPLPDPASSLSVRATLCLEIPHLQMCLSNLPLEPLLTGLFSLDKISPGLRETLSFWNSSCLPQTCVWFPCSLHWREGDSRNDSPPVIEGSFLFQTTKNY